MGGPGWVLQGRGEKERRFRSAKQSGIVVYAVAARAYVWLRTIMGYKNPDPWKKR